MEASLLAAESTTTEDELLASGQPCLDDANADRTRQSDFAISAEQHAAQPLTVHHPATSSRTSELSDAAGRTAIRSTYMHSNLSREQRVVPKEGGLGRLLQMPCIDGPAYALRYAPLPVILAAAAFCRRRQRRFAFVGPTCTLA